jgi:hypothetical protein
MNIRNFEIDYGGYGFSDTIALQGTALVFSSWDVQNHPPREVHFTPTAEEWRSFLEAITPVVWDWRRKYHLDVCDGVCWSVKIEADGFKLRTEGLHLFPENFDEFLVHVRRLIGTEEFVSDFCADDFMSCTMVPHYINRRIRRLMRKNKIKMSEMAARLEFDPKELRHLLDSPVTFEIEYFGFISHILGVSIGELLYETTLDEKPRRSKKFVITPDNLESLYPNLNPDRVKAIEKAILDEVRRRKND